MPQVFVDSHEPVEIEALIGQGKTVERLGLNDMGFADYLWHTLDGRTRQRERKQAGELLANLDSVVEQLGRQISLGVADDHGLIIEGLIGPHPDGVATYQMSKDGKVMYRERTFHRPYSSVMSWLVSLWEAGISIHQVPDWRATAMLVAALHTRDNRIEAHESPFSRYIKPVPYVKEFDPYVLTVMGVQGGGAGEEIAASLVGYYSTPLMVYMAPVNEVANVPIRPKPGKVVRRVGPAKARQLLRAVGRMDVS